MKTSIYCPFAALVVAAISGCASPGIPPAVKAENILSAACDGAAGLLNSATELDKAGQLNTAQRKSTSQSAAVINGICNAATPPMDMTSALATVSAAATALEPFATKREN